LGYGECPSYVPAVVVLAQDTPVKD